MSNENVEELKSLARLFFGRACSIQDISVNKFRAAHQVSKSEVRRAFPGKKWGELQDEWALPKIRSAFEEAFRSAAARERFTIETIVNRLRGTGIHRRRFMRLFGNEWHTRRMQLPTTREKVLTAINDLVARRIPTRELTNELIFKTAGVWVPEGQWLRNAVISARRELLKLKTVNDTQPPEGTRVLALPEGWVNLDADTWDLRPGAGARLKRARLREDIRDIAWPMLEEALLEEHLACKTVSQHFMGYRCAGELLGSEVPDVREATLARVQVAWLKYEGRPIKLMIIHAALKRIFTHLCLPEMEEFGINVKEMLHISAWLYTSAMVRPASPNQDFLSDAEMNAVLTGCLADIKAGLDFTESEPDLLSLSTRPSNGDSAAPVVRWTASLMLLLMLFVGLRPQSVINLRIGDWSELRPGLFALIWFHGKKREEKIAILATSVALLINQYVERTMKVREALGTENVFLTSTLNSYWSANPGSHYLRDCLFSAFVKRHDLKRGGTWLKITGQMLRRTYVTRELYMGRSIWALRLQLGHSSLRTTRRYGKFDLLEHPSIVGAALDEYGRKSLSLWHHPLFLADLEPSERERLLGVKEERHQDVGLCRFDCCMKIMSGNPPPCSMCEHLVTGPEFLGAWEAEQRGREDEIERLQSTLDADHLLAQKRSQYEIFRVNLAYVKGEEHS